MDYAVSLTIPANTLEADAVESVLELCYGTVERVTVLFPPGPSGLVHVRIFRHTRQIWPSTPGESYVGNKTMYTFAENWPIHELPHEVVVQGWNLDDTYEHTVYVHLVIPPLEVQTPVFVLSPALPEGFT